MAKKNGKTANPPVKLTTVSCLPFCLDSLVNYDNVIINRSEVSQTTVITNLSAKKRLELRIKRKEEREDEDKEELRAVFVLKK